MLKQKFCLWWIWYLLFDNAHFQRWLAGAGGNWRTSAGCFSTLRAATARITATMCR